VKDLPEKIEAGEISQEEAIAEIQILREYFDVAKKKVDVSTAINPIAHFLTPTFQDNMELLGHDLDRKEAEILAAIPGAPVGVEGTVRIVSVPVGARIFVDDVDKWSKTDTSLRLVEGVHKLVLKLDDYIDFVREIEVFADKPMSYSALLVSSSGEDPYTPFDPGSGTVPVIVPLDPSESFVEPVNAWQYTITARDSLSGEVLHAKIIVNNVFTGDYTTDVIFLAPSSEYSLRLEAYGYEPAEIVLNTDVLEIIE